MLGMGCWCVFTRLLFGLYEYLVSGLVRGLLERRIKKSTLSGQVSRDAVLYSDFGRDSVGFVSGG